MKVSNNMKKAIKHAYDKGYNMGMEPHSWEWLVNMQENKFKNLSTKEAFRKGYNQALIDKFKM